MLNIEFIDYKDFAEIIYQHIVKNKSIPIKKTLYDELYKNRIIENQKIKQIYDKHGIDYLLDIYVDDSGALFYSSGENKQHIKYEVAKYIIYLCFQHGIYFYWDDETGGLFVAK